MYIDKNLQISNAQAITATAVSTDVIDFTQANPNTGLDNISQMVVTVDAALTAAGAATLTFVIQDSADNATFADVVSSAAIPKATLVAGYKHVIPMPVSLRRYCRMNYVVATGPFTAGSLSAQIVTGIDQNRAYPDSPSIT